MEFLFALWYPKGSKKNWPKCLSGQSVSGQRVTLAKVSFWPKCDSAVKFSFVDSTSGSKFKSHEQFKTSRFAFERPVLSHDHIDEVSKF